MKKKLFACLSVAMMTLWGACLAGDAGTLALYGPQTGTGSAAIVPPSNIQTMPSWTVGAQTIPAGSVWVASNGFSYMSVIAGTATNSPTNMVAGMTDAMLWRPLKGASQPRKGLHIANYATNGVWLAIDAPAVVGSGIYLPALTGSITLDANPPQGAIFGISATTNGTVSFQTW